MSNTNFVIQVFLICVVFGCLTYGKAIDGELKRYRRYGDHLLAQYLADMELGPYPTPHGCQTIGCGLIDIEEVGKKRSNQMPLDRLSESERSNILSRLMRISSSQSDIP